MRVLPSTLIKKIFTSLDRGWKDDSENIYIICIKAHKIELLQLETWSGRSCLHQFSSGRKEIEEEELEFERVKNDVLLLNLAFLQEKQ